jgi:hypothetical protein
MASTATSSPTTMPTSAHIWWYQLQCQPLPISDSTWCQTMYNRIYRLGYGINSRIIINHYANLRPYPILPIALPTTAYIWYYMISDHVESNIWTPSWCQQPYQHNANLGHYAPKSHTNRNADLGKTLYFWLIVAVSQWMERQLRCALMGAVVAAVMVASWVGKWQCSI